MTTSGIVGQRDRGDLGWFACQQPAHPFAISRRPVARVTQNRDRAGDQQAADVLSPRLLVLPNRSLPPLECCRGVIPSLAANSRPDLNKCGSVTVAATALAPMMPTPGTVANRWLTWLCRCHRARRFSISRAPGLEAAPFMSNYLCQILDIAQTLRCDDPTAKPKVGHSAAAE
jgi:hypothetical protein